jgi:hypothetical protein
MNAAFRFFICWALLLGSLQPTKAASTYGSDSFSSAISPARWTAVQANHGTMSVAAANGHASFALTGTSTADQSAFLIRNGRPTANVDWSVEVRGRDTVSHSLNGASVQVPARPGLRAKGWSQMGVLPATRSGSWELVEAELESPSLR